MFSAYKYIYFKLYSWSQLTNVGHDVHELNAVFVLSLTMLVNIVSVPALLELLFSYPFLALFAHIDPAFGAGAALLLLGLNYLILGRICSFDGILAEFSKEDELSARRGSFAVALYILSSPILLIFLLFLNAHN